MTVKDLDRLVSHTELDKTTKQALRVVRHAVMSGNAGTVAVGEYSWSVPVDSPSGTPVKFTFRLQRRNDR